MLPANAVGHLPITGLSGSRVRHKNRAMQHFSKLMWKATTWGALPVPRRFHFLSSALRSSRSVFHPCCSSCIYSTSTASHLCLLPHTPYWAGTGNGISGHSCEGEKVNLLWSAWKHGTAAWWHCALERKAMANENQGCLLVTSYQQCACSLHTCTLPCRTSRLIKTAAGAHLLMQLQFSTLR